MNRLFPTAPVIITTEEANRCRVASRHHCIVQEGTVALHLVHDPPTGVTTLVGMTHPQQRQRPADV